MKDIQDRLMKLNTTLSMAKAEAHEEAYISTEHSEGESSKSLHHFGPPPAIPSMTTQNGHV